MILPPLRRAAPTLAVLCALIAIGCRGGHTPSTDVTNAGTQTSPQVRDERTEPTGVQGYDCADLISEQEIDRITGLSGTTLSFSSRGDEDETVPGYNACDYELPEGYMLNIAVYTGESIDNLDYAWTFSENKEEITGIGESAFVVDGPGGFPTLFVRVRGRGVKVGAGDLEGRGTLDLDEVNKRIAAIVIERV